MRDSQGRVWQPEPIPSPSQEQGSQGIVRQPQALGTSLGPWVVRAGLWDLETSPAGVSLRRRLTAAECKWDCSVWVEGYSRTYKDYSWYFKHPSEHNNAASFLLEPDIFCHSTSGAAL